MIKKFLQKYRTILITIVITAVSATAIASGYFVIKNEKKNANQKVETLQKSIEELQAKNAEYQEAIKEEEKSIPVTETITQQAPIAEKSVEVIPTKAEEPEEEKIVSCVAFDGTTLKVTEEECDEIKQKNAIAQKALDKYDACLSDAEEDLSNAKEEYQDGMNDGYSPYIIEKYNERIKEYNSTIKSCVDARNSQLKKLK